MTMMTVWRWATSRLVATATVLLFVTTVAAFTAVTSKQSHSRLITQRYYYSLYNRRIHINTRLHMKTNNFMDRLPSESDDAYFRRIVATASSPQSFESAVLNPQQQYNNNDKVPHAANLINTNSTNITNTNTTGSKYVRAEVWEEQERERAKSSSNWEERVQYDGQVNGNRFNQNEILRHHLKGF